MELLSNTSSPSITINSTRSDSIYQLPMEPNNLTQQAAMAATAAVDVLGGDSSSSGTVAGQVAGEGAVVEQATDQEFSALMPRLELKLPILSSSSSESESEDTAANPTAGTSADADGERVASPPPNCAICLGRCKNKCFTDSCMHQFCFKCLCEWSKVKPECPLCKQTFKSIIHNVKSIDQFEEYHVQPPIVQIAHNQFDFPQMRMIVHQDVIRNDPWNDRIRHPRFVYTTNNSMGSMAIGGGINTRGGIRNLNDFSGDFLDLYRQEHPGNITNSDTLSQLWRRYVYDRKLYALPVCDINGRFRESSAQFYRDNPAQVHRLAPWINRDIICLLRRSQFVVDTVVESIQSALSIMNILSPAFRRRLTPYLGNKTAHFIHELNNFARSPHDMFGYDGVVEYSPQSNEEVVIEFTSSDDSTDNEINVADDSTVVVPVATTNAINLTIHNRLASNSGRSGDSAGIAGVTSRQVIQDDVSLVIDLRGDSEEQAATADANVSASTEEGDPPAPAVADNIELTSGSSDECEFVLERKPPHLRTPEMVSLDSASDSDVVFVDESKPISKATFSTSEGEQDDVDIPAKSQRPTTRSKITALVEAKKRNQQSANAVKNEDQSSSELFNVGASTSAALRLSIQQRRGDGSRTRRSAYCLRNNRLEHGQGQWARRRGKRLDSESSHSSTSLDSTPTSSLDSSSTSDEEFVASAAQKQNTSPRKRRRVRKSKKSKSSSTKKVSTKRKKTNDNESSCEEDDNGHMGKNFALVMAIGERLKRQQAKLRKYRPAGASDEEDSEGENSWRMEAVHEPLRKQQQENIKTTIKTTERKRKVRKTTQKTNGEQQCTADLSGKAEGEQDASNNWQSSSDESDNLKLIELKSKLITKTSGEKFEEPSISNRLQGETHKNSADSQNQNASATCPDISSYTQKPPATTTTTSIDTQFFKMEQEDVQSSSENEEQEDVGMEEGRVGDELNVAGNEDEDHSDSASHHGELNNEYQVEMDEDYDHENSNETTNLHEDEDEEQTVEHYGVESETPLNISTPLNLSHESNVFDGTSMSTTTTDTILNDAAEQISSAAVNFYNPQPPFNTADFADENTSNSSSSESSVSTTTTTSSSNSSSSNTNGFVNFDLS